MYIYIHNVYYVYIQSTFIDSYIVIKHICWYLYQPLRKHALKLKSINFQSNMYSSIFHNQKLLLVLKMLMVVQMPWIREKNLS